MLISIRDSLFEMIALACMNNLFLKTAYCLLFLNSCKKDSPGRLYPENPNNELKAIISVASATPSLHKSNGDQTLFTRNIHPNGDTVIVVTGSIGGGNVQIHLINISTTGTYQFKMDTSLRQKARCDYIIGGYYSSSVFEIYFSDSGTPPGSVTIEALSDTDIRGSFTANCSNREKGINYVQITNGSFKGTFMK